MLIEVKSILKIFNAFPFPPLLSHKIKFKNDILVNRLFQIQFLNHFFNLNRYKSTLASFNSKSMLSEANSLPVLSVPNIN